MGESEMACFIALQGAFFPQRLCNWPARSVMMEEAFFPHKRRVIPGSGKRVAMSSSALPAFESRDPYPFRVLPDGVHRVDEVTFRQQLVDAFPDSQTRRAICDGFFLLRQDALSRHVIATQWIDGSFVESKLDPEDIDLVTFIDYDFYVALGPAVQEFVLGCLKAGEMTKPQYGCHTFLVPSCLPGHPFHAEFEKARTYWRKWFGQTREEPIRPGARFPSIPKGIIEMPLGDPQQAPQISPERSAS